MMETRINYDPGYGYCLDHYKDGTYTSSVLATYEKVKFWKTRAGAERALARIKADAERMRVITSRF